MVSGCVVLVRRFDFHRRGVAFICVFAIQMNKVYLIINKKSNQWSSIYVISGGSKNSGKGGGGEGANSLINYYFF